ncbi:hypothetical protein ACIQTZ_18015 [Paenarthrobacter sp. NPDC090520]|uniref:hypothetical protein n=1 Tax=Paenarthrobacter sp. NPDC090520 TaxID=3364382 RepID=UPI003805EEC6
MKPEVIVMLTHNDITVPNAREVFAESADLPLQFWGFKDAGVTSVEARRLVDDLKAAGKTAVFEVVTFEEELLLDAARLAVDCGFDYFTGSSYSEAVRDIVQDAGMKYLPFSGAVGGSPIELHGEQGEIVDDSARIVDNGADGIDLVAYRYSDGDPVALAKATIERVGAEKVVVAGSINSVERIRLMQEIGPSAYTIGGALFEGAFVEGGSFRDNLQQVIGLSASVTGKVK